MIRLRRSGKYVGVAILITFIGLRVNVHSQEAPVAATNETEVAAPEAEADSTSVKDNPNKEKMRRFYQIKNRSVDDAENVVRKLIDISDSIDTKIVADRGSSSIIVIGPDRIHKKVAELVQTLNWAAEERKVAEEDANQARIAEQMRIAEAEAQKSRKAMDEEYKRQRLDQETHRNQPKRTLVLKVPGRDPKDVVKVLTDLFGDVSKSTIDETSHGVLVTVSGEKLKYWADVQFLLAEIEATAKRLGAMDSIAAAPATPFVDDEQDAKFDRNAKQLALQLRSANATERTKLSKDLEELNEKHFEYRQQRRKRELDELTQGVDRMRSAYLRRQENKAEVLRRRMSDLTDINADLRWEDKLTPTSTTSSSKRADGETKTVDPSTSVSGTENSTKDSKDRIEISSTTSTNETSSEPMYSGVALSEWLNRMENERNRTKISETLVAMNVMVDRADPRRVARATFRILRSQRIAMSLPYQDSIDQSAQALLIQLPSQIVIEEWIADLAQAAQRKEIRDYTTLLLRQLTVSRRGNVGTRHEAILIKDGIGVVVAIGEESMKPLQAEIRRKSRAIISSLLKATEQDPGLKPWAVLCGNYILLISQQPVTTYPNFIPIVESVFEQADAPSFFGNIGSRAIAAEILGESGLQIAEILQFVKQQLLSSSELQSQGKPARYDIQGCLITVAQHSPEVIELLMNHLRGIIREKKTFSSDEVTTIASIIKTFAAIGQPAIPAIPFLREILEHHAGSMAVPAYLVSEVRPLPGNPKSGETFALRDVAEWAITMIETAKPKPEPEALRSDEANISANEGVGANVKTLPTGDSTSQTNEEPTYDGIRYSQWLTMLETERKIEKLKMAIAAVYSLADESDHARIARGIFRAARHFETSHVGERIEVWQSGWEVLGQLPGEVVVQALIEALRDQNAYKSGRRFQGEFVALHTSEAIRPAINAHADELITLLLKAATEKPVDSNYSLAAAMTIIRQSNSPLSKYPLANQMSLKMIDDGFSDSSSMDSMQQPAGLVWNPTDWTIVVESLIALAPETPDLFRRLMKHASKSVRVIELIGRLEERAQPVASDLVDLFLTEWQKVAVNVFGKPGGRMGNEFQKAAQIIRTLVSIKAGDRAYRLVQEVKLITAPLQRNQSQSFGPLFDAIDQSFPKFTPSIGAEQQPAVFSDDWLVMGRWELRSLSSKEEVFIPTKEFEAVIDRDVLSWRINESTNKLYDIVGNPGPGAPLSFSYSIDPSKTPRQMTIFVQERDRIPGLEQGRGRRKPSAPKQKLEAIYKLTDTSFKLLIAKDALPRPAEFPKSTKEIPEGQFLFEFERNLPEATTETAP